ncbi:secreted protein [gut metagenome]|uniref:Secreted protein n=1 Tax=gut metagenome TaxID=749906 RepID=J9CAN2_9ZZZZ
MRLDCFAALSAIACHLLRFFSSFFSSSFTTARLDATGITS